MELEDNQSQKKIESFIRLIFEMEDWHYLPDEKEYTIGICGQYKGHRCCFKMLFNRAFILSTSDVRLLVGRIKTSAEERIKRAVQRKFGIE